ncbi:MULTISPECIES: 4-hydroxy-tetrahydrodipicolinate synthase [Paenibacillus]|uniref:4-hydroxy-tetrahydrodipicolinate synthase n=1 Tax=Paenibacillus odorifer TaxID=189426 RepID=A0ABX3HA42_9BACL|nr:MULTISPECIES: 4-hydroxy-tetrahydrodipicolinate synthase [Paenibacillus]KAA1185072.1 4-hydroxy-tetrahydrodipicolinate synthase [Paenibacillus sp. B2(2019)]OMD47362.1 4-hydroxy-tetrahydrodipicolinate synthase [Paenibacillus odorifer]
MLTEQQIYGIYVPVVTPFNAAGEVDLDSYQRYVKNIINNSIQGLVVNGTTGESPTVTVNEMQLLVNTSRELLQSTSIPLVVGTGTNDTASTVARTEIAANLGADCALVVVPYYSRPSQEGIIAHFRKAAEVGIPIMAYDIPSRTGTAMTLDTARTILEMNNVVGLKDCSGSTKMVTELVRTGSKPVLGGDDSLFYEMLSAGAAGGMLATANVYPAECIRIYEAFKSGQFDLAKENFEQLLPIIRLLFKESNPAPIKWMLSQNGLINSDTLRLPMTSISTALQQELSSYVQDNAIEATA